AFFRGWASLRREQIVDRALGAGPDHRPLIGGRQEAGTPAGGSVRGKAARIRQYHKGRQVVCQVAQSVVNPGPHRSKARQDETGALHEGGRSVDVRFGSHRVDEGHVIDAGRQVGQETANIPATLSVLLPAPWTLHAITRQALEKLDLATRVERLAVALD